PCLGVAASPLALTSAAGYSLTGPAELTWSDSLKRILSWLFGVPVALLVIILAVANRRPVMFSLDPFSLDQPWFAVEVPLYVLLMSCLILGMLIGGVSAWLTQGKWRKEARHRRQEVRRL